MSKRKVRYRLYALETTMENIEVVQDERFYRITPTYILFYVKGYKKKYNKCYNTISESELSYLTDDDVRWLLDCNTVIIAEETAKHREQISNDMVLMVDRLENALREEKAKDGQG